MLKMFTLTDKLLFIAALLSLVYAEVTFFNNEILQAIFIGLWVPSILGFGIYLKLIMKKNNDWIHTLLCYIHHYPFLCGIKLCSVWWLELQEWFKVIRSDITIWSKMLSTCVYNVNSCRCSFIKISSSDYLIFQALLDYFGKIIS